MGDADGGGDDDDGKTETGIDFGFDFSSSFVVVAAALVFLEEEDLDGLTAEEDLLLPLLWLRAGGGRRGQISLRASGTTRCRGLSVSPPRCFVGALGPSLPHPVSGEYPNMTAKEPPTAREVMLNGSTLEGKG